MSNLRNQPLVLHNEVAGEMRGEIEALGEIEVLVEIEPQVEFEELKWLSTHVMSTMAREVAAVVGA